MKLPTIHNFNSQSKKVTILTSHLIQQTQEKMLKHTHPTHFNPAFKTLQNVFCSYFLIISLPFDSFFFCMFILNNSFFVRVSHHIPQIIFNFSCSSCFLLQDQEAKGLMSRKLPFLSWQKEKRERQIVLLKHTAEWNSISFLRGCLTELRFS